jgi:hypothetical protein
LIDYLLIYIPAQEFFLQKASSCKIKIYLHVSCLLTVEMIFISDRNQAFAANFDEPGDSILMSMPTLTEEEPPKRTGKSSQKRKRSTKTATKESKGSCLASDLGESSNMMPSKLRIKLKSDTKENPKNIQE